MKKNLKKLVMALSFVGLLAGAAGTAEAHDRNNGHNNHRPQYNHYHKHKHHNHMAYAPPRPLVMVNYRTPVVTQVRYEFTPYGWQKVYYTVPVHYSPYTWR